VAASSGSASSPLEGCQMCPHSRNKRLLTHCGRVTQICVFTLQLCRTGDADLRF